ncbi:MAG: hypothetical protein ACRDA5_09835, partial [Clostridium sp.]
ANISKSGYPMILVANEISGTVAALEIKDGYVKPSHIIDKEAADKVINEINNLNIEITLDHKDLISKARVSYTSLTETQKLLVTNLDILVKAEARLLQLEKEAKEELIDRQASVNVIDLINNLPETITNLDKDKIVKAREAFNLLTEKQKALVINLDKLILAETKIKELEKVKQEEDKLTSNKVNKLPYTGGGSGVSTIAIGLISILGGLKIKKSKKQS